MTRFWHWWTARVSERVLWCEIGFVMGCCLGVGLQLITLWLLIR